LGYHVQIKQMNIYFEDVCNELYIIQIILNHLQGIVFGLQIWLAS
jgi:hypothetical protein